MLQQSNRPYEAFSKERREQLAIGYRSSGTKSRTKASITVVVRKRPLTSTEISRHEQDILSVKDDFTAIQIDEPRKNVCGLPYIEPHTFIFDRAYSETDSNRQVYSTSVSQLVEAVFEENARCSCFAYGQTGSGKTYTMMGPRRVGGKPTHPDHQGLLDQAANDIFVYLSKPQFKNAELYISFLEIYCNRIHDLLNHRRNVRALETKVCGEVVVKGLTVIKVKTKEDLSKCINAGMEQRIVASNSKNADSSRGHAILTLDIRREKSKSSIGKLAFIDLAGSERGADAMGAGKSTQVDGAGINRSLLALKECIRSLDQQTNHIPFRDSELTKVLRDMFTGSNAKTLMISCVSPSSACCEQTLNTLRYADRVKAMRRTDNIPTDVSAKSDIESTHNRTKESPAHSKTVASTERLPRHKSISPGKHNLRQQRHHKRIDRLSEISLSTSQHSQVSDELLLSSYKVSKNPSTSMIRTPRHTIQNVNLYNQITSPIISYDAGPYEFQKSKNVDKAQLHQKSETYKFRSRASADFQYPNTKPRSPELFEANQRTENRTKNTMIRSLKNKTNIIKQSQKPVGGNIAPLASKKQSAIYSNKDVSMTEENKRPASKILSKPLQVDRSSLSPNTFEFTNIPLESRETWKNTERMNQQTSGSIQSTEVLKSNLMRAAAEFLSKRYKQIDFPIEYPLKVKEPMSLQTAMHLLEQLVELSADELHQYYTNYHRKCQNAFNELIHFHADSMKRQSVSIMQQRKIMSDLESKSLDRKFPIDHNYLVGLRDNLKVVISSSHRLEKRLTDVEGMEAFLLYVHDVFLKVKNEECFPENNTSNSFQYNASKVENLSIDSKNLDPPVISSRFTTASSGDIKLFCNSNPAVSDS